MYVCVYIYIYIYIYTHYFDYNSLIVILNISIFQCSLRRSACTPVVRPSPRVEKQCLYHIILDYTIAYLYTYIYIYIYIHILMYAFWP